MCRRRRQKPSESEKNVYEEPTVAVVNSDNMYAKLTELDSKKDDVADVNPENNNTYEEIETDYKKDDDGTYDQTRF